MPNDKYSEETLALPITHPPKFGMQFHHNRRYGASRSRPKQSHEEISDSEGVGNSQEGFVKFIKTLGVPNFHWQNGYGLFSVSSSHFEAVRKYILNQEQHHKEETFQEEYLRILKKYRAPYDERYLWD